MTVIALLIAALAAAGATGSVAYWQHRARREEEAARQRAEQEREDALVRDRPGPYLQRESQRHRSASGPLDQALRVERRELEAAREAVAAAAPVEWTGAALVLRILAVVLVVAIFVLGVVLTVEIFTALNGGWSIAATAKGVGAALLELTLAVLLSHLMRHREPRSAAWQGRTWVTAGALAITLVFIYHYAPARSLAAIGPTIAEDELRLAQAQQPPDGAAADRLLITSAEDELRSDRERLAQAQAGDQAQALLFPVGQVLAGELALEGGLALAAMGWHRRRKRDLATREAQVEAIEGQAEQADREAVRRVVDRLVDAGHDDPLVLVNRTTSEPHGLPGGGPTAPAPHPGPPTGPPAGSDRTPPRPSPVVPAPAPAAPSTPPPSTPQSWIDPDALHADPDAGAWDLR